MKSLAKIKFSWVLFFIAGIMILAGISEFRTGDFNYWLISHGFYALGAILFLFDK